MNYILYQHIPGAQLSLYLDSGHGSLFHYHALFVSQVNTFLDGVRYADVFRQCPWGKVTFPRARKRNNKMKRTLVATALLSLVLAAPTTFARTIPAPPPTPSDSQPLDAATLDHVTDLFHQLMEHANKHDVDAIRAMFWDSPSALIVAKSVDPAEGNWAGFWGVDAVARKIHDIAASGPVTLYPDFSKLKAVGISSDVAETYIPLKIAVSYGGQDPAPRPFLMICEWRNTSSGWKIASEIIVPVPPSPVKQD